MRAVAWLGLLIPVFFTSYNFANWFTAHRSGVGSVVFEWESAIPLVPWTIVPYWSLDLLYGLSFLFFFKSKEMDRHGMRLLTVQIICIGCFLLFPLHFSVERPHVDGLFGQLFDVLMGFDKPYNQAPSLHIAILIVLWPIYAKNLRGVGLWMMHGWFLLIGISVLTTWQHHFIDIPTGILTGAIALWLWPLANDSIFQQFHFSLSSKRKKIGSLYLCSALVVATGVLLLQGGFLWLAWVCVALLMVAGNYFCFGAFGFQKNSQGEMPLCSWILFAPYWVGGWLNIYYWTRGKPAAYCVAGDVWIGRFPLAKELHQYRSVVDCCAELPMIGVKNPSRYHSIPILDLTTVSTEQCILAANTIENESRQGSVLVCCALGYSRSAAAIAAWLIVSGRCQSAEQAVKAIRIHHPDIVLTQEQLSVLAQLCSKKEVSQ